jgi:sulfatase modifying factor 1
MRRGEYIVGSMGQKAMAVPVILGFAVFSCAGNNSATDAAEIEAAETETAETEAAVDVEAEDASEEDVALDEAPDDPGEADAHDAENPCPPLMALVDGVFCVDLYEGALEEQGADGTWSAASPYLTVEDRVVRAVPAAAIVPQGYISGTEARAACERSGKRLCTSPEWLAACQGPAGLTWPYGDEHVDGACNDHYAGVHPVVDYFGTSTGVWDMEHMNDPGINQQPGTVAQGGDFAACVGAWGAFDMHGNLHEWVEDADGIFRGGFYADASINGPGCLYVTTAHETTYHDYSTGFRCCADPR